MAPSVIAAAAAAAAGTASSIDCHFAGSFTCDDFQSSGVAVSRWVHTAAYWEGKGFARAAGVSHHPTLGFTYDGHPLDYYTGAVTGEPHLFSAASKECIHVGLLARAIEGDAVAQLAVGDHAAAMDMLTRKIATYEAFNSSFPGFGCYMPWVTVPPANVTDVGIVPNPGWANPYRTPGLDNGELAWAALAAAQALRLRGHTELAARWQAWFDCMAGNAQAMFWTPGGNVSAVVTILNASAPVTPDNYLKTGYTLNDPYEGETFTVLLDLFGDWSGAAAPERELLWVVKRPQLQAVALPVPDPSTGGRTLTNITTQRGYWYSTHEQWKTMLLPGYTDSPTAAAVFSNAEKARTWDAHLSSLPGMFASVNDVTHGNQPIPDYDGATGVQALASQPVLRRDVITPYSAFALYLHNASVAACWHRNMLDAGRAQGPHGSTEGITVNGTYISPLTTWDSKMTTILAAAGGTIDLVRSWLAAQPDAFLPNTTMLGRHVDVVEREYKRVFPVIEGTGLPFALPAVPLPPAPGDPVWPCA